MRRISKLETELSELTRTRRLQRKQRARSGLATVTIVGYTNAGKSTLLNTLTDAGVLTEDRLFATLDPTTRRLALPGGETVLLTDTVGFVRRLPHGLVEAFKCTLEVATTADYLLHVVDASAADPQGQIDAVRAVLERDRRRRRARAARRQQVRHRPGRGQGDRRGPSRLGGDQRGHRCRHRRLPHRPRATGCARSPRWSSSRCRTTAATSSPRSTARARSCRPPTNPAGCGCGPGCRTPRPGAWREFVVGVWARDHDHGLRPAAVSVRPPRSAGPGGRAAPGGVVDLSIGTPIDPPPPAVVAALSASDSERGYPPSIGSVAFREAAARWISRRFGVDVDAGLVGACVGTKEFVGTLPQWLRAALARSGHRALSRGVLPDVRDGGDARRLPGRSPCRSTSDGRLRLDGGRSGRRRAGARAVGQQPGEPDRGGRRPRGRRPLGPRPRRAGVLRRVLRRVHVVGPRAQHPRARPRRRGRRALAVQAVEPGRRAGRVLRRRRRPGALPAGGAQARRNDGARARPRRPVSSPSTTTTTSSSSAAATAADSSASPRSSAPGPAGRSPCPPVASTCGSTPATAGRSPSGSPPRAGRSVSPGEFYGADGHVRVAVVQPDERIELVAERLGV